MQLFRVVQLLTQLLISAGGGVAADTAVIIYSCYLLVFIFAVDCPKFVDVGQRVFLSVHCTLNHATVSCVRCACATDLTVVTVSCVRCVYATDLTVVTVSCVRCV